MFSSAQSTCTVNSPSEPRSGMGRGRRSGASTRQPIRPGRKAKAHQCSARGLPGLRVEVEAVDYLHAADERAARIGVDRLGQADMAGDGGGFAIRPLGAEVARAVPRAASVDVKRVAVEGAPGAHLDALAPAEDRLGVGLLHAERESVGRGLIHTLHSPSPPSLASLLGELHVLRYS